MKKLNRDKNEAHQQPCFHECEYPRFLPGLLVRGLVYLWNARLEDHSWKNYVVLKKMAVRKAWVEKTLLEMKDNNCKIDISWRIWKRRRVLWKRESGAKNCTSSQVVVREEANQGYSTAPQILTQILTQCFHKYVRKYSIYICISHSRTLICLPWVLRLYDILSALQIL